MSALETWLDRVRKPLHGYSNPNGAPCMECPKMRVDTLKCTCGVDEHEAQARAELAALRSRADEHDRLISTIREVTDRWCMTTDDYIVELRRIYAEYKRLRDADVARQRAALSSLGIAVVEEKA